MLEIAEAAAAVFFLDGDTVQAERADLGPEILGNWLLRSISAARDLFVL
jgi:hypothetical protein